MKKNVGTVDQVIRIVLGLAILWFGRHSWWWWIGFLPLLTGIFRFCPGYPRFGMKTCSCCCGHKDEPKDEAESST